MTDQPAAQYVTLNDQGTQALFTADGRVFYDLRTLITTYTPDIFAKALIAKLSGDREAGIMALGARSVLQAIMRDADDLLAANGHPTLTDEAVAGMAAMVADGFDPDTAPWGE